MPPVSSFAPPDEHEKKLRQERAVARAVAKRRKKWRDAKERAKDRVKERKNIHAAVFVYMTPLMTQHQTQVLLSILPRSPAQEQFLAVILAGQLDKRDDLLTLELSKDEEQGALMMHLAAMVFSARTRAFVQRDKSRDGDAAKGGHTYVYQLEQGHSMDQALKVFSSSITSITSSNVIRPKRCM